MFCLIFIQLMFSSINEHFTLVYRILLVCVHVYGLHISISSVSILDVCFLTSTCVNKVKKHCELFVFY